MLAEDYTCFRVLGRTRDDAAGEAFDKAARALGYPYPGGAAIGRAAKEGDPAAIRFPRPVVDGAPYDFSFSGLKTAVLNYIHNAEQRGESYRREDVAASFQAAVVDMLAHNFLAAAVDTGSRTLVLAGGVVANEALRARITRDCDRQGFSLYMPPLPLCGDNAAMIGAQAYYEIQAGHTADASLNAFATMKI